MTKKEITQVMCIVVKHEAEAISIALQHFIRKYNVDVSATYKDADPLITFAKLITAEFADTEEERKTYPAVLDMSLLGLLSDTMTEPTTFMIISSFWQSGDNENLARLVRTIAYGETLLFMEKYRFPLLKLMRQIRGELP